MYNPPEMGIETAKGFGIDLSTMQTGDTVYACHCGWKSQINPGAFKMECPNCGLHDLWFFTKEEGD